MHSVDPTGPTTHGEDPASDSVAPGPAIDEAAQSLEARYGRGKRSRFDRRAGYGIAGTLVLLAVGFFFFSGWQQSSQVEWQDIGYTKRSELVLDVKFQLSAPANTRVACAIEALNTAKASVGWKILEVPPSDQKTHTVTTKLVVTNPATAATARECWVIS